MQLRKMFKLNLIWQKVAAKPSVMLCRVWRHAQCTCAGHQKQPRNTKGIAKNAEFLNIDKFSNSTKTCLPNPWGNSRLIPPERQAKFSWGKFIKGDDANFEKPKFFNLNEKKWHLRGARKSAPCFEKTNLTSMQIQGMEARHCLWPQTLKGPHAELTLNFLKNMKELSLKR